MSTHNLCFEQQNEKKKSDFFYLKTFSFLVVRCSIYLNRRVFVMYTVCKDRVYPGSAGQGLRGLGSSKLTLKALITTAADDILKKEIFFRVYKA